MRCKLCDKDMKMRLAKQGKNQGNHFWGCSDYPNCKGVQDATAEDVKEYNNAEAPKPYFNQEAINSATVTHLSVPLGNAIIKNESQSSYEFGPAKNRHKIYYNDIADLMAKINALNDANLIDNELEIKPEDFGKVISMPTDTTT